MTGAIFGVPLTIADWWKPGNLFWCDWILLGESDRHSVEPEPRLKAAHVEGTTYNALLGGRKVYKRFFMISREFVEGPALWAAFDELVKSGALPLEVKPRDERRHEADRRRLRTTA